MIKNFRIVISNFESCRDELANIDTREADAQKKLEKAAESGDISDPKTQRIVGDARLILDLCQGRKRLLKREIVIRLDDVMAKFRECENLWASAVNSHIAKLASQYNGVTGAMGAAPITDIHDRRLDAVPAIADARKAHNDLYMCAFADYKRGQPPGERVAEMARSFCNLVSRHSRNLGIELPAEPKE
jgi:hypothetical protein